MALDWHRIHQDQAEKSVLGSDMSLWREQCQKLLGCVHLCSLWLQSLSHCELITDDGIRHLGNGACAHDQLEVIELDNCPLITDASLEHLKSCHSLERIELYDCQQITRAGIKRLRVKSTAQWSCLPPRLPIFFSHPDFSVLISLDS